MTLKSKILAGVAGSLMMMSGAAMAADIPMVVTPPPPAPAPAPVATFPWDGVYVGAYGTYAFGPGIWAAGGQAGVNMTTGGGVLFGVQGEVGYVFGPGVLELEVDGRAGFLIGDRALLYGTLGIGTVPAFGPFWNFGGGAELALGQALSVFGEFTHVNFFGGPSFNQISFGLNWHLGN